MLDFRIRYSLTAGEMGVTINGVNYVYFIDAGFIPKIEKLARWKSGKALTFLKRIAHHYEKED